LHFAIYINIISLRIFINTYEADIIINLGLYYIHNHLLVPKTKTSKMYLFKKNMFNME